MTQTTPKNAFVVRGCVAIMALAPDHDCLIDSADLDTIVNYTWRPVRTQRAWYAKTTVGPPHKRVDLSMHRILAKTPTGMVCHHRNRDSLDNRSSNLINMTKTNHDTLHANNNLTIKRDPTYTPARDGVANL